VQVNRDFTIEPFKSKPIFRSDKGKKHSYPKQRKCWNLVCHGQTDANLSFNPTSANDTVMDTVRAFKHSAEIREYWRLVKRKQRARPRSVKNVKTDRTRDLEVSKRNV
jgi:hypothetical protein